MIWRMPGLASVVIVSLGVGIGVNTAVFSWIQAMVLQPIPGIVDASGVQLVEARADTGSYPGVSWPEYRDLHDRMRTLPDLFAYRMVPFNVGESGRSERTHGLLVSANYFSALGLKPALGRFLQPDEATRAGGAPVVVISYSYWQTRFAGSPTALNRTLRVNDRQLTIVGVTPERFQGTVTMLTFDLWVPATMAPDLFAGSRELEDRSQRGYNVAGRFAPTATRKAAQSELDVAMGQLAHDYPESNRTISGEVRPFWQAPRGPQQFFVGALALLQGVLLLLLLAVCGNTANLMLARASARYREIGVRLTLGAGPWRVVSLLLTENLLLALLGAALGAAIAVWATDALRAVPMIASVPVKIVTGVDALGLAFALGLGLLVRAALRDRAGGAAGDRRSAGRAALGGAKRRPQPAPQWADGHRSRARDRRPDGRRAVRAQFQRHAQHRSGLSPRRRAARRVRSVRPQPRRPGGARLHRAAADAGAGVAGRRGGGDCQPGTARHSRPVDARLHARGARAQRCRSRPRAQQHRHAGLFQDDGHPAASGTRLRTARGCGDAAAGDRQRRVRAALCRRRRAAGTPPGEPRQKLRDRGRRRKPRSAIRSAKSPLR